MLKLDIWLYKNNITKQANSYYGRIRHKAKLTNKDIAQIIIDEGSEFKLETLINIINQADKMKARCLAEGNPIESPFVNARLSVQGKFDGPNSHYNNKEHQIISTFSKGIHLDSLLKEMRAGVLGIISSKPYIEKVINEKTGLSNQIITPLNILTIHGKQLKISGNHPDVGIYLINTATKSRITVNQIITNYQKKLLVMVPKLSKGNYWLEIVTQQSRGSFLLKKPIACRYAQKLLVL